MGVSGLTHSTYYKFSNLFLRGISMGAKFLFALYVSKFMQVEEYGEYTLMVTSITFLMFLLGLDYYSYTAREILATSGDKKFVFIKHQFVFHSLVYLCFAPLIYLFCRQFLSADFFIAFYVLLVLEHFSQELYRIFIFHDKHLTSNILLAFRTFLWVVLICLDVQVFEIHSFSTELILTYWIFGSFFSFLIGLFLLYKEYPQPMANFFSFSDIDFSKIRKALMICIPILVGTISYKLIEYSDRFIIDIMLGKEQVGIYGLFSNYANVVNIIVNTVVTLMIFPKLVSSVKKKRHQEYIFYKKKFRKELILVTFGISILLAITIFPVLDWINKEEYNTFITGFFLLLIGNVFLNLSFLPHYLLYSFNKDKKNIAPMVLGMFLNIALNLILLFFLQNIIGAAIATAASFILIYFLKTINWFRFNKDLIFENGQYSS
ncbi:lipopolysaccharide biosynthesis protein [Flagellimonas flava]|uniref:lipopolysaccharide biosynthesis protein n=1 Tax=Flagellimonas flava TaxID=570519 RepID=UPI003D660559